MAMEVTGWERCDEADRNALGAAALAHCRALRETPDAAVWQRVFKMNSVLQHSVRGKTRLTTAADRLLCACEHNHKMNAALLTPLRTGQHW